MRRSLILAGISLLALLSIACPSWSADVDPVNRAIDRGVAALKKALKGVPREDPQSNPKSRGYARMSEMQTGVAALAVLTALECGVPVDDPAIQKRLPGIREASVTVTHTYTLAVSILVFDKIGDPDDVPLIHSMALRLLAGQYYAGGWSYYCPPNAPEESKRLAKLLKERATAEPRERKPGGSENEPAPLPEEVQQQLKRLAGLRRDVTPNPENFQGRGDNSNTQLAVLGLWVARRHGIPIVPALAAVEARFRKSQNPDGGWGYVPAQRSETTKDTGSTPAMTCAGLMILGICHAAAADAAQRANLKAELPELARDPTVRAGFGYLGGGVGMALGPNGRINPRAQGFVQTGYYYLWSLERVGVGYNLKTIGNKDWYAWGANVLVASQEPDGCWQHEYGPIVDTCFALLFLKRVNLVEDVTRQLTNSQSLGEVSPSSGRK